MDQFSRTKLLIKDEGLKKLKKSHVIVFGVGGVGGYVVEALARSGVGKFTLVDNDKVNLTNINRQIIATLDTVGLDKVDVMKDRILSINKDAEVIVKKMFYLPETSSQFNFNDYDYVVDCVDTVSAKISIIVEAKRNEIPVISAMGAGNKLDPTQLVVSDISKTEIDPLARVMRRELRNRGINHLKVIYSKEKPVEIDPNDSSLELKEKSGRPAPGSIAFVPSVMGLIIASEIVKDLIGR